MVEGLDRFGQHFASHTSQYILIGGVACTLAMDAVERPFRATKDLDIVLCVEALGAAFAESFWDFVRSGEYQTQEKATGEKRFYRFQEPAQDGYPFMLELFSRTETVFLKNLGLEGQTRDGVLAELRRIYRIE